MFDQVNLARFQQRLKNPIVRLSQVIGTRSVVRVRSGHWLPPLLVTAQLGTSTRSAEEQLPVHDHLVGGCLAARWRFRSELGKAVRGRKGPKRALQQP